MRVTDAFLEPEQIDRLGDRWHALASLTHQLEELVAGSVMGVASALGIRIARAPASRPPINVAAHDHLDVVRTAVTGWARCLLDDALVELPRDTSTAGLARHLHINADRIALCQWAPDCLAEVEDLAAEAERITGPDENGSIADRHHLAETEVHHRAHQAVGEAADMVAVHRAVTGETISDRDIHQWRRRGKLPDRFGPAGEPWFHYHEIAVLAREARVRREKRVPRGT